jgi:hypothetical protein
MVLECKGGVEAGGCSGTSSASKRVPCRPERKREGASETEQARGSRREGEEHERRAWACPFAWVCARAGLHAQLTARTSARPSSSSLDRFLTLPSSEIEERLKLSCSAGGCLWAAARRRELGRRFLMSAFSSMVDIST